MMGKTFENLTWDDLCDLMCGMPKDDSEGGEYDKTDRQYKNNKKMLRTDVLSDELRRQEI